MMKNVLNPSCPAQGAWRNGPIKLRIRRSKIKLFPDYSSKLINSHTNASEKKVVRIRFRERELPGSSQELGKSGLRLKSCVFSKLVIVAGLTSSSSGASHPGTLKWQVQGVSPRSNENWE